MLSVEHIIALQSIPALGKTAVPRLCALAAGADVGSCAALHALIVQSASSPAAARLPLSAVENALALAERIASDAARRGIGILTLQDAAFPASLLYAMNASGRTDPSPLLYYRGSLDALFMPGVAVVGTRNPTPEGWEDGAYYGAALAEAGCNVTGGLALGCDAQAHRGALSRRGVTTAFLAHGLDMVYPREHLALARAIVENGGLLLSEHPAGVRPSPRNFVARNRLQVALVRATLVIQAGAKGGTMHTGNMTLAAHKPLFCVRYDAPSEPATCLGNAMLVRAGGRYVERRHGEADILRAILP